MRILAGLTIAALCATSATAVAAQSSTRLTDSAYMQAARCVGLASSANLGATNAKALSAWLQSQSSGRDPYILDKADQLRSAAKRQADRADDYTKSKLAAELSGACASLKS